MSLIPFIAVWFCAAPAGYLAGDVYVEKNQSEADYVPWLSAALPPLAAVLAVVVLTQIQSEENSK